MIAKALFTKRNSIKSHSILNLQPNSDTSDIPYFLLQSHSNSYLFSDPPIFLSPLFCFCSPLLYYFCPTFHVSHAVDNHVVPFSSCSHLLYWLKPHVALLFHPLFSSIFFCSGPLFLVFKLCISFDTTQSDYCVLLHYLSSIVLPLYPTNSLAPDFSLNSSVWPLSNSGLWPSSWNYRTYPPIVQVGATHKLKPSPTCYPLPITC